MESKTGKAEATALKSNSSFTTLSFSIQPLEGALAITPLLNGELLSEIVSSFEREHRFEPAGGYGGLIPEWFKYGPLDKYFLGQFEPGSYFAKMERIYLLGCDCGEVGCWPFLADVDVGTKEILWNSFEQPFRRERDYSGFGPFVFAAKQYREAVESLWSELNTRIPD